MAALVPELYVSDVAASLDFYTRLLGFTVRYARADEGFAYLERDGAELMIEQPGSGRAWLVGSLEHPYGRGISLQIATRDVVRLYETLESTAEIVQPIERKTYARSRDSIEVDQFVIADPDGYLLRFSEVIAVIPKLRHA